MAIDEAGQHHVLGGAHHAIERTLLLQLFPGPGGHNVSSLHDKSAIGDVVAVVRQCHHRIARHQHSLGHRSPSSVARLYQPALRGRCTRATVAANGRLGLQVDLHTHILALSGDLDFMFEVRSRGVLVRLSRGRTSSGAPHAYNGGVGGGRLFPRGLAGDRRRGVIAGPPRLRQGCSAGGIAALSRWAADRDRGSHRPDRRAGPARPEKVQRLHSGAGGRGTGPPDRLRVGQPGLRGNERRGGRTRARRGRPWLEWRQALSHVPALVPRRPRADLPNLREGIGAGRSR